MKKQMEHLIGKLVQQLVKVGVVFLTRMQVCYPLVRNIKGLTNNTHTWCRINGTNRWYYMLFTW